MIKYLSIVKIIDIPFYEGVETKVLDKRANAGGEYLLDLNPPRWISKKKVVLVNEDKEQKNEE